MNIRGYLSMKYGVSKPTVMTRQEARLLSVPWPLEKGWLDLYGNREIDEKTAAQLIAELTRRGRMKGKTDLQTDRFKRHSERGIRAAQVAAQQAQWNPGKAHRPESDAFLESYEWRRVRVLALHKYGSRCMACGSTPEHGRRMCVDHIKPRALFPELALDINNLQVLCDECNHGKGNWNMTDWRVKRSENHNT